ncbi:MAG: hypothetical protein RLZZ522_425 [Verrucomicrobiota bacterium]
MWSRSMIRMSPGQERMPEDFSLLVRVVAIAEFLFERQIEGEIAAGAHPALAEEAGDGGVVGVACYGRTFMPSALATWR